MRRVRVRAAVGLLAAGCLVASAAHSQPPAPKAAAAPRLEAVADTKLLMNGLADPNLKGLGRLLKEKPKDAEAWAFARGQALLVAETGNLLMLRPPKTRDAQDAWMARSAEMREAATALANATAAADYVKSRTALAGLANTCNRCHRDSRVANRVNPFPDGD